MAVFCALLLGLGGCQLFERPTEDEPLPEPVDVQATEGIYPDRVRLSWTPAEEAVLYEVERASEEEGPYTKLDETSGTAFDDTDVSMGLVYWYRVRACSPEGCGPMSDPASGYASEPDGEVPSPPTGITASTKDFDDKIVVRWDPADRAQHYEVYRAEGQDGVYAQVGVTDDNTYEDTGVPPGRSYWYRVRACGSAGCSALSPQAAWGASAALPDGAPNPPRTVAATSGDHDDRVHISWASAAGARRYEVWRAPATTGGASPPAASYSPIGATSGTSFDDTHDPETNAIDPCATYWYTIIACNAAGCGDPSEAVSGHRGTRVTGPVGGVTVTDGVHPDRIRVSWGPVEGAKHYAVYRHDQADPIAETEDLAFDDTTITEALPTTYTYRVQACGEEGCGCGPLSLQATGSASPRPGVPVELTAEPVDTVVELNWEEGDAIEGTDRYEVYRATSEDGQFSLIGNTTTRTFNDTTGASGVKYWYYVQAFNAHGSSTPSDTASARMP